MRQASLSVIFLLGLIPLFSQSYRFQQSYGTAEDDRGQTVVQASDGKLLVLFKTFASGMGSEMGIMKIRVDGTVEWARRYGGNGNDNASQMIETSTGDIVITGNTTSFGSGKEDAFLMKLNSTGDYEWGLVYGESDAEFGYAVAETPDGGFALFSTTRSFGFGNNDFMLVRTDDLGNVIWARVYGTGQDEIPRSGIATSDSGFVAVGRTTGFGAGSNDLWMIKILANGDVNWSYAYGSSNSEEAFSVIETSDSGFAAAGWTNSFSGNPGRFYVLRTDDQGNIVWSSDGQDFGPTVLSQARSIVQTSDGNFLIAGNGSPANLQDGALFKLDNSGNLIWYHTLWNLKALETNSVVETADSQIVVTGGITGGVNQAEVFLAKADPAGDPGCFFTVNASSHTQMLTARNTGAQMDSILPSVLPAPFSEGGFSINQTSWCIISDLEKEIKEKEEPNVVLEFQGPVVIFRNEDQKELARTRILRVYDMKATMVAEEIAHPSETITLDASHLDSGLYFYRISSGSEVSQGKFIIR